MRKTNAQLIHGLGIPAPLLVAALVGEFVFYYQQMSFYYLPIWVVLIYAFFTITITCNYHGKNVNLKYEQEMSLIYRGLIANFGMLIVMWPFRYETIWMMGWLSVAQIATIIVLCYIVKALRTKDSPKCRLYICRKGDVPEGAEVVLFIEDAVDPEVTKKKILEADSVYLFDLPAQERNDFLKLCFELGRPAFFTSKLSDIELRHSALAQDGDSPIFYMNRFGITTSSYVVKRIFDLICSGIALVVLSPLFLLIAILVKAEDGEDIFYRQTRCTMGLREFQILKFRSMVIGAEETKGVQFAGKNDPRLTKIGYILRKTKMDELPQLVNIFRGDMSIVGPRPERPELISQIVEDVPEFIFRNSVPAGLTGYAQVHGRYHTQFLDKLKWDLFYIQNQSFMLDLKIIMMTIPVVLRGGDDV